MDTHPVPRLSAGSPGFTSKRIRSCLTKGLPKDPYIYRVANLRSLNLRHHEWDLDCTWKVPGSTITMGEFHPRVRAFCLKVVAAMQHSTQRLELMDTWLDSWTQSSYFLPHGVSVDELVERAMHALHRLPACSTAPPEFIYRRPQAWYSMSRSVPFVPTGGWEQAAVARHLDNTTICIALHIAIQSYCIEQNPYDGYSSMSFSFGRHLDNLALIMNEAMALWRENEQPKLADCYLELTAFVWTAWQRSLALSLYDLVRERLTFGYITEEATRQVPFLVHINNEDSKSTARAIPYVCPWAFGLIRANAYACGGDLRIITRRYAEYCEELDLTSACCIFLSSGCTKQCSGDTLEECNRFTGLLVEDQSAHAENCWDHDRCAQNRLLWDPVSYNSVLGGRAVSVSSSTEDGLLRYCPASERTLTVSHVWSHGQGGRPDVAGSGMNGCLHERYCRLALAHDCDSYWIDTACIPSDHDLREEAINEINQIFSSSKVTLICDKDLLRYDIADLTLWKQERILSMLLLCDWNLRAWTFLEAMRGRSHLHLLCKYEKSVSVRFLLETVLRSGSLDLLGLFADAHHLVPNREKSLWHSQRMQGLEGIVSTEVAACLLSRRHASREGDEIVIWSLLCGGPPHQTAEAFWQQHQAVSPSYLSSPELFESDSKYINTAFLVSTAPRMKIDGLRWAPARPAPEPQIHPDGQEKSIYPVIGLQSVLGSMVAGKAPNRAGRWVSISDAGLSSNWDVVSWKTSSHAWWEFPFNKSDGVWQGEALQSQLEEQYLRSYCYGALLRTVTKTGELSRMTLTVGERRRELAVVAGCNELDYSRDPQVWTWLGVISVPLLNNDTGGTRIILR
jgi:hypothetical protein